MGCVIVGCVMHVMSCVTMSDVWHVMSCVITSDVTRDACHVLPCQMCDQGFMSYTGDKIKRNQNV